MHIFIEGGASIGKTQVAEALYEPMVRYYNMQSDENPYNLYIINVALM